jgi:PAT family beta-lactamase induction signal transducer AmpG
MTRREHDLVLPSARKIGLLGALYFSQGLPFGFFTQALPVLMRKQGYSLGEVGLSSLLAIPWALKFLWAPLVDRRWNARIGRRKSWILPTQLLTAVVLIVLAVRPPTGNMNLLLGAVFLVNLFAATQDIATDGLAVDMLNVAERGLANGIQVGGYRVGMIIGGGLLLMFLDRVGWETAFVGMGLLTALATLPALAMKERHSLQSSHSSSSTPSHFLRRPGAIEIVVLLVTYKFGDAFSTGMLRPFLADAGLPLSEIGKLLGTVGFVAGLLGALAGGALVNRVGRRSSLLGFGALQALTVAGYAYLAHEHMGRPLLYVLCAAEHFAGGMATAALFTCMMDWCGSAMSATDYTVQASAVVVATGIASSVSGFSAQALGYFNHFVVATVLAAAALVAVALLFPKPEPTEQISTVHEEGAPCASPSTPGPSIP